MQLVGGSNPLFGLNALGGALAVDMKNGFNYDRTEVEVYGGAWGRVVTSAESGGNNGRLGYYINVSHFDENGWRDASASNALNVFSAASFRDEATSADLNFQYADSDLTGNGPVPVGLLELQRDAIFTAPDITENELFMFTANATRELAEQVELAGTGFYRNNRTDSFNGDTSDFAVCGLGTGDFLLEGLDDDELDALGLDDDDVCSSNVLGANDPAQLETLLNALAPPGDEPFNLDDLTGDLTGSGILGDQALNNISGRDQVSYGTDLHLNFQRDLFGRGNFFLAGFAYFRGEADFDSVTELSGIDPISRSTRGLGLGSFVDELATDVRTSTATWSLYVMNALDVTERLTVTVGGRYNDTNVELDDRSGARPELNGDHTFSRFNPTIGATFDLQPDENIYASYSESSRAPTPIELACNDDVFTRARAAAVARGEDPDDINFECRLPNAFLADPPLAEVVAKSFEGGLRGQFAGVRHRLGYFRTDNHDDIIFQTTGRGTGLFANVDKTRRVGFESGFSGALHKLDWSLAYSYVRATFEDDFAVLSPNHPLADANGEVAVSAGDRIPGIPDHQLKVGADVALPWSVRVGGEVLYNAGQFLRGDETNALAELDGYAVVNLRASYRHSKHLELFARITNLFDRDFENFGLIGDDPSEVLPGLSDNRPLFVGAGAPRGGWVGIRLTL